MGTSVSLVMPETHDGYVWSHWLGDGDPNRAKTVVMDTNIVVEAIYYSEAVGGIEIPASGDKSVITAYEIGLAILLIASAVSTIVYVKKRERSTKNNS